MFDIEEFKVLKEQFDQLGITGEDEQNKILEYFCKLGKIIYEINVCSYGKEN